MPKNRSGGHFKYNAHRENEGREPEVDMDRDKDRLTNSEKERELDGQRDDNRGQYICPLK